MTWVALGRDDDDRLPRRKRHPGEKTCKTCGIPFRPRPNQKLPLCPYHERLHRVRQATRHQREWRQRQRYLAEAFAELRAVKRSR